MTKMISFRLKEEEAECVAEMARGKGNGAVDMTEGELIRLLLVREYRRRRGLSKPKPGHYQEQFRRGRGSWGVLSWKSVE